MPNLRYSFNRFPAHLGQAFRGTYALTVSWPELIWAATSVGKAQSLHMLRFGIFSLYEMAYRVAIVYANLRESRSGFLERTTAYQALDPSEKGAVSYFLGLTTAKLLAHRLLDVPWLLHLDVYRAQLAPIKLTASKAKPDLVGLNRRREWLVLEAKGRSGRRESGVMTKAKQQTRRLRMIGGQYPFLRVAHVAFFAKDELRTHWEDPDGYDAHSPDAFVEPEEFLAAYYAPLQALMGDRQRESRPEQRGNSLYDILPIQELDVRLGLRREAVGEALRGEASATESSSYDGGFIGKDGVLVEVGPSWSEKRMMSNPDERQPISLRDRVT